MITPVLYRVILFFSLLLPLLVNASALKDHPSPYLNMHANDPVQWQVWGKEALDKARRENKLVFLSIGYFSCHWCHVMQRESYQDEAIGAYLNENYVPVKVDRELRPVLDRRMIRFVETVRGQAGWPLNVFVTPDGYPVTGFTYLPRDNFNSVLQQLNTKWSADHSEIKQAARQYFEQTELDESKSQQVSIEPKLYAKLLDGFVSQAMLLADEFQGGFGETTKFPSYPQLNALIRVIQHQPNIDPDVINFVRLTLDEMASRHLLDHLNDGFFRYTTDPDWQTPHFEKMLYDNAQLAMLYLDAEKLWPGQGYREVGLKTVDFIIGFLGDDLGGFNSSLSAVDINNVEGGAYFWTKLELEQVLAKDDFIYMSKHYDVSPTQDEAFLLKPVLPLKNKKTQDQKVKAILKKLRTVEKPLMPVDDKKIASWNALVLRALLKAQDHSKDKRYGLLANRHYQYITQHFIHRSKEGKSISVNRFATQAQGAEITLEDYAHLALALKRYAMKTGSVAAGRQAEKLVEAAFAKFFVKGRWIQNPESLVPGDKGDLVIQDNVLESPSSILLQAVLLMPELDEELQQIARELVMRLTQDVLQLPYHYGSSILTAMGYIKQNKDSAKLSKP